MTHGTIMQSVGCDGRTFIIIIHEAVLFYRLRQQNSSCLQLTDERLCVLSLTLIEILVPSTPRRQFTQRKLKEYQNMIYLNEC